MDNDDSGTFNAGDMALANVTVWLYAAGGADYGVDPRAIHRRRPMRTATTTSIS
jgi:hypothetical protein